MNVAWKRGDLPDVGCPGQPRCPALEPDRESSVRRHAVAEDLEVTGVLPGIFAPCGQGLAVVAVVVQALSARDEFEAAEQQVEAARVAGPGRVVLGVERPLAHRETRHEQELAAM